MHDVSVPETENVSAFWEDGFAGREPGFRLDLKLKFKSRDDGIAFLKANGIPTVLFTQGEEVFAKHPKT